MILHPGSAWWSGLRDSNSPHPPWEGGALPDELNPQKFDKVQYVKKDQPSWADPFWSGLRGSNSLPPPWQGGALPDELNPQMVPSVGIEPTTRGFSVLCSTN